MSGHCKLLLSIRQGWKKSEDEIKVEARIPKLIQDHEWHELRRLLSSPRKRSQFARYFMEESEEPSLVFACRFNPPIDVISLLFSMKQEVIDFSDRFGRGPLHYACKHAASPEVIEFFLHKEPSLATKQDSRGRTPLHLTCQHYMRSFNVPRSTPGSPLSCSDAVVAVIYKLCNAAPIMVNLEDVDGRSALEYAIEGGLPVRAVRKLQKSSQDCWKRNDDMVPGQAIKENTECPDRATRLLFTERCQQIRRRAAKTA